jgi:hypothetical protein
MLCGLLAASGTAQEQRPEAVDFVEPKPRLETAWTSRARSGLSLSTLEYVVDNTSATAMQLTATLVWDAGTTEGRTATVDTFTVPPGQRLQRRVQRSRIPAAVRGQRYPGLIQLSLESREGETAILPAFFVMPLRSDDFPPAGAWPHELMDEAALEAATREVNPSDQEGGARLRVVEWRPSNTGAVDPDGGE